jgi:hypothetical protein
MLLKTSCLDLAGAREPCMALVAGRGFDLAGGEVAV